jgi:hypothetical protein
LQTCAFTDEINFEKFKKVVKNLIEGARIWTPITLTFFMINPNLRLHVFKIIVTTQFQALVGGDGITLQNLPNYDEFKPLKLVTCDKIKPL